MKRMKYISNTIHDMMLTIFEILQVKLVIFSISLSTLYAMFKNFISIYVFDDFDFLFVLGILLMMDMTVGMLKSVIKDGQKISGSKFIRITIKFFNCVMILVSIHILQNFGSDEKIGADFLKTVGRTTCIIYFLASIVPNLYILSDKKLPIGWLISIIDTTEKKLNSQQKENENENNN